MGGKISGRLEGGGYCTAALLDEKRRFVETDFCTSSGEFNFSGLRDSDYFLMVFPPESPGSAIVWPDRTCLVGILEGEAPCALPDSAKLQIRNGTQLTDLSLTDQPRGHLKLSLNAAGFSDLDRVEVELFAADRSLIGRNTVAGSSGEILFQGLPPGDLFIKIGGAGQLPHLHPDIACYPTGCPFERAERVAINAGDTTIITLAPPQLLAEPCRIGDNKTACLENGRFEVEMTWRDATGRTGQASSSRVTDQSATFWFFVSFNTEVIVKVLNACSEPSGRFWVFAAGLTDVETELRVRDTFTNTTKIYRSPLGQAFSPVLDTEGFDSCRTLPPPNPAPAAAIAEKDAADAPRHHPSSPAYLCSPSNEAFCVQDGRFKIKARFLAPDGVGGPAQIAGWLGDSVAFTFFDSNNVELVVKVLDGCSLNDRLWIYAAGLTDVFVEIEVTDLASGDVARYSKEQGRPFAPILDVGAFARCDAPYPRDVF